MLKMAFEKLYDEFENLKGEHQKLKEVIQNKLKSDSSGNEKPAVEEEYLDAKEVLRMLGICGKTLWSMERAGHIVPIRINKRRKKYSKLKILEFMEQGVG